MQMRFDDSDTDSSVGFSLDIPDDSAADYLRGLTAVTKHVRRAHLPVQGVAFTIAGAATYA